MAAAAPAFRLERNKKADLAWLGCVQFPLTPTFVRLAMEDRRVTCMARFRKGVADGRVCERQSRGISAWNVCRWAVALRIDMYAILIYIYRERERIACPLRPLTLSIVIIKSLRYDNPPVFSQERMTKRTNPGKPVPTLYQPVPLARFVKAAMAS